VCMSVEGRRWEKKIIMRYWMEDKELKGVLYYP